MSGKVEPGSGPGIRLVLVISVGLLLPFGELSAQETIASDRPGLGNGSAVIGTGIFQLELGAEYAVGGGTDFYSFGQGLLRYGLAGGVELQALLNSFTLVRGSTHDREGFSDIGLGMKVRVLPPAEKLSLSILSTILLPTGSRPFSSEEAIPALALLGDLPLSGRVGLTGNLGYSAFMADAENQLTLILTPSVSLSSDVSISAYGGYAGFYADSGNTHYGEGGVTWLPSADLQLDLNGGFNLDSGDYFFGVGVATRWGGR
ncbi:MAG: transporter [Gemmatimonadetes bacterium]|nr:transporter [Gemmatimonadota bacterium]